MRNRVLFACAVLFLCAGFFLGWWIFSLVGLLLAAYAGRLLFCVCAGIVLDLIYGVPVGWLHMMYAPFTVFACALVFLHASVPHYIRKRPSKRLL